MEYINRDRSIITGGKQLEFLYEFKNFPVFIACTDKPAEEDLIADMRWQICSESGIIQLERLLPLDIVYSEYHSEAIGGLWKDHHLAFCDFIASFKPEHVLEIGGSNGFIARNFTERNSNASWTIIEPVPLFEGSEKIRVIKGFFDENFQLKDIDTIVHSHVLEHFYEPQKLLLYICNFLTKGSKHLFSIPNLYLSLKNKFTNTLNFEHTCFLTEYLVDYLLARYGFKIIKKVYFYEHSIFYYTEKNGGLEIPKLINHYKEYRQMFLDSIRFYNNEVNRLNELISNFNGEVYLFGAHVFSQFLIHKGLFTEKIAGIIDNSTSKTGKRLYGTKLYVNLPQSLKNKKKIGIILKVGNYQEEVKKQLREINRDIVIWE